jgi:hypothetical protein
MEQKLRYTNATETRKNTALRMVEGGWMDLLRRFSFGGCCWKPAAPY